MNNSKQMSARERINFLLDDNSFVEIGALVSARNTDFNMKNNEMPSDGVVTDTVQLMTALSMCTVRMRRYSAVLSVKCTLKK